MKATRQLVIFCLAFGSILVFCTVPAESGSHFGLHVGSGGFGVSVGIGDWGIHTSAWSNPQWSVSFNTTLDGYGEWVWVNGLGRCWRPWVAPGWQPYTYGRWVRTGVSLTWVAYEPWGYIPHHYGSWAHATYGWVWVPGYTYYSANVSWVRGSTHVGWYARPPHGWSHAAKGFHHGYQHGYRDGYHDGWNDARYGTYVGWQHFGSDNIAQHAVKHTAASKTRLTHGGSLPNADELWRNGRSRVSESRVSTRKLRMDGRDVTIARPEGVATSIERHASATVHRALSDSAQRMRQPDASSRRSEARQNTATRSVDSAIGARRSKASESQSASPSLIGRRSASAGPPQQPSSKSLQSRSRSLSTKPGPTRIESGRRIESSVAHTRTRGVGESAATSRRHPSSSIRSVNPAKSLADKRVVSDAQSRNTRRSKSVSPSQRTQPEDRTASSTQKRNKQRTVPTRR